MKRAFGIALAIAVSSPAHAAPTNADAKAAFDRGVAAYTKGDFAAAAEALEQSYKLDPDPDTLFAWAQAERKASHCAKAIKLYERLLKFELPAENKQAVRTNLDDCRAVVAANPPPAPATEPEPTKIVEPERPHQASPPPGPRPWWKDPVGDALVGFGAVGVGVGIGFLVSARSADQQAHASGNYFQYSSLEDTANSRSKIGLAAAATGGVLLGAGIWWYATHREHRTTMSAWLDGHSAGFALRGGL